MGELHNKLFQPTRIISDMLNDDLSLNPGALYFLTDTGEMYLDLENERIQVGGRGVSLLYGDDPAPEENAAIDPPEYILKFTDKYQIGDLILNTDGCFYRIINDGYLDGTVVTYRMSVSGTGGGSGSGEGGGSSTIDYLSKMDFTVSPGALRNSIWIKGQPAYVTITAVSEIGLEGQIKDPELLLNCT